MPMKLAGVGVVFAALLITSLGLARGNADHAAAARRCPLAVPPPEVVPMRIVVRTAARLLRVALRSRFSEGEIRGFVVVGAVWLNPDKIPGAASLRRVAAGLCGKRTAEASWGLVVDLPRVHLPASRQIAFLVKTANGWRVYF